MSVTLEPLTMQAAADFWRDKLLLGPGAFAKLSDEAKMKAFAVSGIAKGDELTTVYRALQDAIEKGISFGEFKKRCKDIFERRGWTGKREWRVQNIFRTNIQTAYNSGRYKRQKELGDIFPYLQYSAVNDRRTRPTHKAVDGLVFPLDHPFWDTWYPPNGYRCRCSTFSLTKRQVERRGLKVETNDPTNTPVSIASPVTGEKLHVQQLLPDAGFANHPGKMVWGGIGEQLAGRVESWPPKVSRLFLADTLSSRMFEAWYKNPEGNFPVGYLKTREQKRLGAKTRTTLLSEETVVKQKLHHPELTAAEYISVQETIDKGVVVQDGEKSLVFVLQDRAQGYVTVVKSTLSGESLFVTSFRRLSGDEAKRDKEVKRLLKKGRKK